MEQQWQVISALSPEAEALARAVAITPLTAQVLCNRGVTEADVARGFLRPSWSDLHDPFLLKDMAGAADRIRVAAERDEPIAIYGDYDVDGITGTAILLRCLNLLGIEGRFHLPDRLVDGYGLNVSAVRALAEDGTKLLVTVDCGINAVEEIALARELGMDVIVTDHHEPGDEVPACAWLLNPKLPGCAYPFRELSGAGLAFKLAWAIGKEMSPGQRVSEAFRAFLLDAVSLAGMGTIADMVPLRSENRVLAHYGLKGLGNSSAVGIRALCEAAEVGDTPLTTFDLAFKLAPRLNAAGRLGSARQCIELLTTTSANKAREIAANLNRENTRRRKLQDTIADEARAMVLAGRNVEGRRSIVLAREGWHAGVLGIVASHLAREFWRPTVLLVVEEDEAHGSARSVGPLNLFEALQACKDRLCAFGGHAMAAGLRLKRSDLERFTNEFETVVSARLRPEDLTPTLEVDAEVNLEQITRKLVGEFETLAPFGVGNREPVLAAHRVTIGGEIRRMGASGKHISFWARQNGAAFRTVGFNLGDMAEALHEAGGCSLAFVPRVNRWRGSENIELEVRDIRLG